MKKVIGVQSTVAVVGCDSRHQFKSRLRVSAFCRIKILEAEPGLEPWPQQNIASVLSSIQQGKHFLYMKAMSPFKEVPGSSLGWGKVGGLGQHFLLCNSLST